MAHMAVFTTGVRSLGWGCSLRETIDQLEILARLAGRSPYLSDKNNRIIRGYQLIASGLQLDFVYVS